MQERDFYDITRAYLRRAHADAVVRAELFLGPQSFTERGMAIDAVMDGVLTAMRDADPGGWHQRRFAGQRTAPSQRS